MCLVTTPSVYDVSVVVPAFAQASCELDQEFLGLVIEFVGNVVLDGDVVVAVGAGVIRHALTAQPQLLAARRAGRDLDLGLAVDRRDGGDRAEDRAIERDPEVGRDVAAVDPQPATVAGLDGLLELGVLGVAPPAPAARAGVVEVELLDVDPAVAPGPRGAAAEELAEQVAEIEHAGSAALRAVGGEPARHAA